MYRFSLIFVATLALVACSSDLTLSEEQRLDLRQPMIFGSTVASAESEETRATNLENAGYTDFKVGVWKAYGQSGQQNVMDGYKVQYSSTPYVDDTYNYYWEYFGILAGQIRRYWDLGAFPYEFRAVAPYVEDEEEVIITPSGLTINKPFKAQNLTDDALNYATSESEPYVVAHVSREKDDTGYTDTDKIKNTEINTTGKANPAREVHVPFHHLISKVGFKIFIDDPMPLHDNYEVYIRDITIYAIKEGGFITESGQYTATTALGHGVFGNLTKNTNTDYTDMENRPFMLLDHTVSHPYKEDRGSGPENVNFHYHLNKDTAFDLTPGCLQQIPQSGVKLMVHLDMETVGVEEYTEDFEYFTFLHLDPDNMDGEEFEWEPEKKYIYYLRVANLHGHEIILHTCEVLPWDDVQTSDIAVEL